MEELLDQLVRLTALQVKLGMGSQAQAILELQRVGFSTNRISELLGTTPNTVNVTIQKNKKRQQGDPEGSGEGKR